MSCKLRKPGKDRTEKQSVKQSQKPAPSLFTGKTSAAQYDQKHETNYPTEPTKGTTPTNNLVAIASLTTNMAQSPPLSCSRASTKRPSSFCPASHAQWRHSCVLRKHSHSSMKIGGGMFSMVLSPSFAVGRSFTGSFLSSTFVSACSLSLILLCPCNVPSTPTNHSCTCKTSWWHVRKYEDATESYLRRSHLVCATRRALTILELLPLVSFGFPTARVVHFSATKLKWEKTNEQKC